MASLLSIADADPTPEEARLVLSVFARDPVLFVREVLGADPWGVHEQIMRALTKPRARVAVKSCHASGKTWSAAQVVLWWVYTGGAVITTAPTWTQVKLLLWSEIRKAHEGARVPLGGVIPPDAPMLKVGPDCYAIGLSTNKGVRFQGWHGERMLMVLDEAPGVRTDIYEAIEGVRAGGDVRVLAQGNPMAGGGPFFDAFQKDRAGWTTFTIDAFGTPNLAGVTEKDLLAWPEDDPRLDAGPRPYLISRRYVREKLIEWGPTNPLYQAKVLGRFPDQDEHTLLWLAWLEAARTSENVPADTDKPTAGIDVAGPGEDETVLAIRTGPKLEPLQIWREADPLGHVVAALQPWKGRLEYVNVDAVGIGFHFAKRLKEAGFPVVEVNVGESPSDKERFVNLRAEIFWGFRERCEAGDLSGLADDVAMGQMSTIRYEHDARGRVKIESKDDAKKRGVKSPDRAEAIILAFSRLVKPERGFSFIG